MMEFEQIIPRLLLDILIPSVEHVMASRPWNELIKRDGSGFIERWMLGRNMAVPDKLAARYIEIASEEDPNRIAEVPSEIGNIYLHRYIRNDTEDFHCHPWANVSLVLKGFYIEETQSGMRHREAGDLIIRHAEERHRIIAADPGTITLFLTGQKIRDWGFWPEIDGVPTFVHHARYRNFLDAQLAKGLSPEMAGR